MNFIKKLQERRFYYMKNKDIIILKKILKYCSQVSEDCEIFENDYDKFLNVSVFHNVCCMCILQIGELCKVISDLHILKLPVQNNFYYGILILE